ncbi:MAG: CPBP family intramembrane glutamic endopeptidase [Terracoccus sp.]
MDRPILPPRQHPGFAPALHLGHRRVLRPGRWLWLRALAWLLLLFFVTAAAFGLPLQWAVDQLPAGNNGLQFTGLLTACGAAVACYVVAVRLGEGRTPRELALAPAMRELAAGSVLGVAMMTLLMGILAVTNLYDVTWAGPTPGWAGAGLAVQAAVTEELWVRALLLRLLWRVVGPVPAFAVVAVVFAALHLANPGATPLAAATVAMAGLMFSAMYALTGRLWLPLGLHFAWNFAQGYVFGAAVSGGDLGGSVAVSTPRPGSASWLTGGAFGPEASVFALVLVSVVTAWALWRITSRSRQLRPSPHQHSESLTTEDVAALPG